MRFRQRVTTIAFAAAMTVFHGARALAGPSICTVPEGVELSENAHASILARDAAEPSPWGYAKLLERVRENRRDLAAGRITAEEAEARGGVAITGIKEFPVFPILFTNSGPAPYPRSTLEQQLTTGPWTTGTLRQYYREVSYGLFDAVAVVSNWTTMPGDDVLFEGNNNGLGPSGGGVLGLGLHAVLEANDDAIDFGRFDNDGPDGIPNSGDDDGFVDFVTFIHPEMGGECAGGNSNIWSHAWFLSNWNFVGQYVTNDASQHPIFNRIRIDRYFIAAGTDCNGSMPAGIATTAHELGHALGIKDLYDTVPAGAGSDSEGIGNWGLMGAAGTNSASPNHMTAWSKERLGWLSYFDVFADTWLCLPPVETEPAAVRLWTNGDQASPEYFVVENRQALGFDQFVDGTGLVIYHVDEDIYDLLDFKNQVNAIEQTKAIDVECADATTASHVVNADDLDRKINRGDTGDVWGGGTQTDFFDGSTPGSRSNDEISTNVEVRSIGQDGTDMCALFKTGQGAPSVNLCMSDCAEDDCSEFTVCDAWWGSPAIWIDNDGDGNHDWPDEGEINRFWFRVENLGPQSASQVEVELYYGDPGAGQQWPPPSSNVGDFLGQRIVPIIGAQGTAGAEQVDYIEALYPTPPPDVGHYCIGAIAGHPSDPINADLARQDNNIVQVNHQVFVERAEGLVQGDCGTFMRKSLQSLWFCQPPQKGFARLRLGTPPDYTDWSLPDTWQLDYPTSPLFLQCTPTVVAVTVSAQNAPHGENAHLPFTLVNTSTGEPMGGFVMDVEVDCVMPALPVPLGAGCLEPSGDQLDGPTILVAWEPVLVDVDGNPERVKNYQILRGENGGPMALVDQTALDDDLSTPGFQWYDDVVLDPNVTYRYDVRAIDATNNPGDFVTFQVNCATTTGTGDAETPAARTELEQNRPNPFNPRTSIGFSLARAGHVRLSLYDLAGRLVRTLADEAFGSGRYALTWDGRDDAGAAVSSGVYVYRLEVDGQTRERKMTLIR